MVSTKCLTKKTRGRIWLLALMIAATSFLAGCGTFHGWGQKSAGSAPSVGAGISVPLSKE